MGDGASAPGRPTRGVPSSAFIDILEAAFGGACTAARACWPKWAAFFAEAAAVVDRQLKINAAAASRYRWPAEAVGS